MDNILTINNKSYRITEPELHFLATDDTWLMYLGVGLGPGKGCLGLWEIELVLLDSIDKLDGKRIHLHPDGESYDDDTLGTDIIGAYAMSDLNYLLVEGEAYIYGEILVDFKRIQGMTYHCHIEFTLTDSDEDEEDMSPEDYNIFATADFTVTADEKDPLD